MARQKATTDTFINKDALYVCIKKCYFNSILWDIDDATNYVEGIEESPYFEKVE